MTTLQVSIGILNDVVDAPRDAGRTPPKPIPAGLVAPVVVHAALVVAAVSGLALSLPSGWPTVGLAVVVLVIGYGYDLVAKGTAWSWVPFAIGIPVLPIFAWVGTLGMIPDGMTIVIVAAVLAGAALAIANARADVEQDRASGTRSVAIAIGLDRSWWVASGLFAAVSVIAAAALVGSALDDAIPLAAAVLIVGGVVALAAGASLGRAGTPDRRERAWEVQTIAVAVLATGYLLALSAAPT